MELWEVSLWREMHSPWSYSSAVEPNDPESCHEREEWQDFLLKKHDPTKSLNMCPINYA